MATMSGTPASSALSIAIHSAAGSNRTENVARITDRRREAAAGDAGGTERSRSIDTMVIVTAAIVAAPHTFQPSPGR